jgi:hypothetical protein
MRKAVTEALRKVMDMLQDSTEEKIFATAFSDFF